MANTRGVWLSLVFLIGMMLLAWKVISFYGSKSVPVLPIAPSYPTTVVTARSHTHPLLFVTDGDTIRVLHGEDNVIVRMIGMDAPETGKGDRPRECFGDEASTHLAELLHGAPVSLVPDPSQSLYDKYGRALMYIEQDGKDMNALMIADGYAREYTYRVPYERQTLYRSLEDDARYAKKGLWAPGVCDITSP